MFNVEKLVKLRKNRILNKIISKLLLLLGIDIPYSVQIGKNVGFPHNAVGTVIHNNTIINDNVKIYQNVTIGRANIYEENTTLEKIIVEEGAIICSGAKVLGKKGVLILGKNSIVAANAVLLNSIGENEIWGGIPAKKIGMRNANSK